jgi:hypothetical protein
MKEAARVWIFLSLLMCLSAISSTYAVNIAPGGTVTQDFTIGTSATASLPAGWKADKPSMVRAIGTYVAAVSATEQYAGNAMSTSAANGIYNYGAGVYNIATDRAIGFMASAAATKSGNVYVMLTNNGANSISSFTISYDVEKYRMGTNAAGFYFQMYYSADGSSWTSAGSDFLTSFAGGDASNNGYASAPGATSSVSSKTLTVTVAASSSIYLAWNWSVSSGSVTSNAQGLGIDNVSITANGSVSAPSTQASAITFSNVQQTQMTIGWINGNGAKRIVLLNTSNNFTNPANSTDPTANTVYGGSSEQCIYNGIDNSVTVTGLTASTIYWLRVYECNGSGALSKYLTTTATNNPNSQQTSTPPPNAPVANEEIAVSTTGFTAAWNTVAGATSYRLDVYTVNSALATDLIISEYIEGSSSNKYIEIFNGTGISVDLSGYYLRLFSNGAVEGSPTNNIQLSGTLANGGCIVYMNSSAVLTLPNGVTAIANAAVNFNGDDAVALYKNTKAGYVDIFGRIGEDPGTSWGISPLITVDKTLVRKSSVTGGVTANPTSGFPTLSNEWDSYASDTATYLGSHTLSGSTPTYVPGYQDLNVGNVTSYLVSGLSPRTTYYYVVRAVNAYGTSSGSNVIAVTTDAPLPVELSTFTAIVTTQNNVLLEWTTQSETGVAGFYIYRGATSDLSNAERIPSLIHATNTSQEVTYVFTDREVQPGHTYYYWLQHIDLDNENEFHGPLSVVVNGGSVTPPVIITRSELLSAYPNPFTPDTTLRYTIEEKGIARIDIYNVRGRLIRSLVTNHAAKGYYRIHWDGTDLNGNAVSSGVYYARMTCGSYTGSQRLALIK